MISAWSDIMGLELFMYVLDGLLVWVMLVVSTCVRTFEILSGQLDIIWSMHECKFFLKNVG